MALFPHCVASSRDLGNAKPSGAFLSVGLVDRRLALERMHNIYLELYMWGLTISLKIAELLLEKLFCLFGT